MVKTSKKTTYKKNFYKGKSKLGYYLRNYAKARHDVAFNILMNRSGLQFKETEARTATIDSLLNRCKDYAKYRDLFASMKVTGIALNVIPGGFFNEINASSPAQITGYFQWVGNVALSYLTSSEEANYSDVIESDNCLILSQQNTASKYISFGKLGGSNGWFDTTNQESSIPGKLAIAASELPAYGAATWTVKISIYVTYKIKA